VLKDKTPNVGDLLVWKWNRWPDTSAGTFGNPTSSETYTLCLFDTLDGTPGLVYRNDIPPGGMCGPIPCWRAIGLPATPVGFKYLDTPGNSDGMTKLKLKSLEGKPAKIEVRGKGENLPEPSFPLTMPVAVQLQTSAGECWGSIFAPSGLLKNDTAIFKARSQ
jgi:hypothetical protein